MQDGISGWREDLFTARKSAINLLGVISMSKVALWYSLINVFEPLLLISNIGYVVFWSLQGPPMGTSSNGSSSSKRKKGEKNKRYDQHRFMGELFVLPFFSKFPIPSDANASQTRIINE